VIGALGVVIAFEMAPVRQPTLAIPGAAARCGNAGRVCRYFRIVDAATAAMGATLPAMDTDQIESYAAMGRRSIATLYRAIRLSGDRSTRKGVLADSRSSDLAARGVCICST